MHSRRGSPPWSEKERKTHVKRRLFAMLAVLAMVLSLAAVVSAEETQVPGLKLDVTQTGASVVIAVSLEGCDGVTNGRFTVGYDADVLTLETVETTSAYAMSSVNDETAGTVAFAWVGSALTGESTRMLTLTLAVTGTIDGEMTYTANAEGIYVDTQAVDVADDSVTLGFTTVDTTELEEAVEKAEALKPEDYTADSFAAVETALEEAAAVLADPDATQAEVDAAADKLNAAIKALVQAEDEEDETTKPSETTKPTETTKPDTGGNAGTGDESSIYLWIALLGASFVAIIVFLILLIRSGKKDKDGGDKPAGKSGRKGGKKASGKRIFIAKKGGKYLSILLVAGMLLTMVPVEAFAAVNGADTEAPSDKMDAVLEQLVQDNTNLTEVETTEISGGVTELESVDADLKREQDLEQVAPYADNEMVRIIVELEGQSLLEQGYTQNQIALNGTRVSSAADTMKKQQNSIAEEIARIVNQSGLVPVGRSAEVKYHYTVTLNGMALNVPYGTLPQIRLIEGVKGAYTVSRFEVPESVEPTYTTNMYATSESFGSATVWNELGYTGQGMTIAIIDTGLDLDHPSFAAAPEGASLRYSDIQNVVTELNAYALYTATSAVSLTADKVYHSEKVPFGFNYVDASLDVTHDYDGQGDHGTHVAGIAAANRLETTSVVGVAPDAQLVIMKVFGQNGGAFSDDIIAAIEDCIRMDIDVINMSLGAQAGFSEDSLLISQVYGRILETDMLLAVAAGNANSAASGNHMGTNLNLTQDPDNGLVNSPATYLAATTVASLENTAMMMPYFSVGEHKIAYVDVTYFNFAALEGTYEYVVVPGVGDVSDYEGLDVQGKIALVQRGTIDFVSKQEIAFRRGAVALVVYDNVYGDLISMYDGGFLPNVFISRADGEIMLAEAVDGVGTMVIEPYGSETAIPNSVAGLLSDFSCWGVTPDLQLTPDVTAPGGNIYSCYTDGAYGTMSGTSMASPHIAGMSALVLQYLHEQYPDLTAAQYHIIAESLVMCTAVPVYDTEGVLYSPRKQGAGSANVYNAVSSPVYLTSYQQATNEWTPKGSLGDDPGRTGKFTFSFEMHNLTADEQVYLLDGSLLTDQYLEWEGMEFMSETGRDLTGTVSFEILNKTKLDYDADQDGDTDMDDVQYLLDTANGLKTLDASLTEKLDLCDDGIINTVDAQLLYLLLQEAYEAENLVTVPANSSVTVNVTVQLSAEDMAYMDAHYVNGIYADGFVRAYAQSEGAVDLSLPFVGFYGDWTDARMLDNGWYYDAEVNDENPDNDYYYNRYLNVVFATLGDYVSSFGGLGINPYLLEDYDPEHNVLSPNGDLYYDFVPEIYISLMRSAELLDFTWYDTESGEQLFYEWYAYARKSYYWSGYGMCLPAIYTDADCQPFTMLDENGELLVEDLQHLTLTIRGYLDDGDLDAVEVNEDGDPVPNTAWADEEVNIPVVIDLKAPTMDISSVNYYTEGGRNFVSFDVEDNYDIAAVVAMTTGGGAYEYIPVTTKEPGVDGEKDTITLDITGYDAAFQVVLCDYGCNESYYQLSNQYNTGLSEDSFYAFRRYSTVTTDSAFYATDQLNGWYSFGNADAMLMHTAQANSGEATVFAAEYVDGYIFGAQAGADGYNTLFVMKAGSWERQALGSDRALNQTVYEWPGRTDYTYFPLKMIALDMTYDYTTGTMYLLANALESATYFPEGEANILLSVDLETGAVKILGKIFPEGDEPFLALTLACDGDGKLYTVNYENGLLYTIDPVPVETTPQYGYGTYIATSVDADGKTPYYPAAYTQSMTFDHATGKLWWAGYQGKTGTAYFIELSKETGDIVSLVQTADNAEMVGLFKPWHSGEDIIPDGALTGIALNSTDLYLNVGQTHTLTALAQPYNGTLGEVTWTSSNENVAVVSGYGIVEARGIGACTVTATCGGYSASCVVNVCDVSGTLFAYSGGNWLLMDAGAPEDAAQIADAMAMDGSISAAAYLQGYIYVAALEEHYDADYNVYYTTNLYKLDVNTLSGIQVGSYDGKTTALAFNYADGFMYGLVYKETFDAKYNVTATYTLIRLNLSTCQVQEVATLDAIYPYSDITNQYNTCSGALAIDYAGNFYVNGDNWDTYSDNTLVRFNLEGNEITNIVTFAGFADYNWQGDSMVWSQRNGGILRVSGTDLSWVDVSDMENVVSVSLGNVRSQYSHTCALVIPLSGEPELPVVEPTAMTLEEVYTVAQNETIQVIPTLTPWNATAQFTFSVADETVALVDEKGVVTGLTIGETTLTVTIPGTELTATAKLVVEKNPGYLFGFAQADIAQGIPLNYWIKMPLVNTANSIPVSDAYAFTIYAAEFYDGYIYASAQSTTDGLYYLLRISAGSFNYEIMGRSDMMIRDMAFDYTTGTMYLVGHTDVIRGGLYQMDLDTAELTLIGDNDAGATLATLACDDEGNLYTADTDGNVYAISNVDACLTATGITGSASPYLQAMTYDWNNDAIYWAVNGSMYRVNVAEGALEYMGLADIDSGEMATVGCVVSGLFSVPAAIPTIPETVTPTGVVVDAKNTVAVGETVALNAVVLPVSVTNVDQTIRWTSGDESIATVDENGVVTGVSAGTVYIFAADSEGHEASTLLVVTEEHRYFYGYDEISRSWVSFDFDGTIVNTWPDAEGLSPIVAAQYIGDILYAYDAEGYFYSVDTETFQRTLLGDGIHGLTVDLEAWDTTHDETVYYVEDVPYQVVDMTYTIDVRGNYAAYAVIMAYNISAWRDSFSYKVVKINLADGTIANNGIIVEDKLVDNEMSLRPTNLIYRGGSLYTINGYITGMVTRIDVKKGTVTGENIFASYWGDFNGGRSLIEDPMTGQVYAIRDMRTDYIGTEGYNGAYAASELCTVSLGIARCDVISTIGTNMRITGLFIK